MDPYSRLMLIVLAVFVPIVAGVLYLSFNATFTPRHHVWCDVATVDPPPHCKY